MLISTIPSHLPASIAALLQLEQPALILLDSNYKIMAANRGAFLPTGFQQDQISGLGFFSLFEPLEREKIHDCIKSGFPRTGLELQLVTTRGRRIPVGLSCSGAEEHIWVSVWDLRPLRDLKSLADEARDRVERISNMGDVGIIVYDQDFRIEFANQVAGEILGCPARELLGGELTRFLGKVQSIQFRSYHSTPTRTSNEESGWRPRWRGRMVRASLWKHIYP